MNFGTFDIETTGLGGKFLVVGVYNQYEEKPSSTDYKVFYSISELIDYFVFYKSVNYWYAHNGGKYDFRYLIPEIIKKGYIIKPLVINGSMAQIKVYNQKNKKLFELRDSFFILPASLKKLTYDFNVEHKKLEINDYESEVVTKEMLDYLRNDVIGLYEVIYNNISNIYNLTGCFPSLTFGSTSLKIYSTMFKDKFNKIKNIDNKELRDGYFGGRCEVFNRYIEDGFYYDVNSLYPYVMKNFKMPIGEYYITKEPRTEIYISKIEFIAPTNLKIPILPIRKDKKLIFGVGKGIGVYSSIEIKKALEYGYKINYIKTYNFKDCDYLFSGYVDFFYNVKKRSDKNSASYQIAKLYLNSLYGKFGQHNTRDSYIINPKEDWINKNMNFELVDSSKDYLLFKKTYQYNNIWVNIPISIFITSYARIVLFEMFEKIGFDNVYYCDTDSIITSKEISSSLELGDVKLEDHIKQGYFLFPKVYAYTNNNDEIVLKGKGFDNKKLRFEDYVNAYNNNDYTGFSQEKDAIAGFKTTLKRFGTWINKFKAKKTIKSNYDKRILVDKNITKPIDI